MPQVLCIVIILQVHINDLSSVEEGAVRLGWSQSLGEDKVYDDD